MEFEERGFNKPETADLSTNSISLGVRWKWKVLFTRSNIPRVTGGRKVKT
jgi:hypothetical protein